MTKNIEKNAEKKENGKKGGIERNMSSYKEVWMAIDTKTNRIVDFGGQSAVQISAAEHQRLSGNRTIIRTLKIGMIIGEYE